MAKKGGKSKGYLSKGQRPNVSKKTRKLVRKERNEITDLLQSRAKRDQVVLNPQNKKEKELRTKYLIEDEVLFKAGQLLFKYSKCGLTKAAAVMAVKTDRVNNLTQKWSKKLIEWEKVNA